MEVAGFMHTVLFWSLFIHHFMFTVLRVSELQTYVVHNFWHNGCVESATVFSFMYNPALEFHYNFQFTHLWPSMDYFSFWNWTTSHFLKLLWNWPCQLQIVLPTTLSYYFRRTLDRQLTNLSQEFNLKVTSVISSNFWKVAQYTSNFLLKFH